MARLTGAGDLPVRFRRLGCSLVLGTASGSNAEVCRTRKFGGPPSVLARRPLPPLEIFSRGVLHHFVMAGALMSGVISFSSFMAEIGFSRDLGTKLLQRNRNMGDEGNDRDRRDRDRRSAMRQHDWHRNDQRRPCQCRDRGRWPASTPSGLI